MQEDHNIHMGRSRRNMKVATSKASDKKPNIIRRIIIMAILEVILLFGMVAYAHILKRYSQIQRPNFAKQNVNNENLSIDTKKRMSGYRNIAVFGVDSRNSDVGKGNNSDVIMIVSINQGTGEIKIVSVFRDTYLNTGNNKYNKINSAYANGGPEQAVKALNQNLDLNITEYITFNWKAVAQGINTLGGVDINITKAELYYINGYITETVKGTGLGSVQIKGTGMHHLDGVQAVAYARLRYMDSDFARTERQREIVKQVFENAKKADLATLDRLASDMLSQVATNLDMSDILSLASDINSYYIGETGGFPFARGDKLMGSKGACVIPQTLTSNVKKLHEFLFGESNYTPSDTVQKYSRKITEDSGMYNEGTYIDHVGTDGGYIYNPNKSSGSNSIDKEKKSTRATDENGDYIDVLYETDDSGKVMFVYETDEDGNIVKVYETDSSGKIIGSEEITKLPTSESSSKETLTDDNGEVIESEEESRGIVKPTSAYESSPQEITDNQIGPGMQETSSKAAESTKNSPGSEGTGIVKPTAPTTASSATSEQALQPHPN